MYILLNIMAAPPAPPTGTVPILITGGVGDADKNAGRPVDDLIGDSVILSNIFTSKIETNKVDIIRGGENHRFSYFILNCRKT